MRAAPAALARAVPLLRCPVCGESLSEVDTGVTCRSGHRFDRARQGYLTLFGSRGRRFSGDTAEQVDARERVLGGGLYAPVVDAVAGAVSASLRAGEAPVGEEPEPVVLEAGAGTGTYLAAVLARLRASGTRALGIGTEISVPAARRLARVDDDAAALVADTWEPWPIATGSLDAVLVVFAPRNAAEFARVLRTGGALVVATPAPGHLEPVRSDLGMLGIDPEKGERMAAGLGEEFSVTGTERAEATLTAGPETIADIALMGPSGVHLDRAEVLARLGGAERRLDLRVEVTTHRRA